ncbi:DNA-binding NarL/FixJ family response regulator [Catenulispora sp. GP43]|uniref:helix-turn-helix transcriptional regulator n=1 Tax=Catenulispora sp. GP43 TaxID=3156263 RepID=UPI003518EF20
MLTTAHRATLRGYAPAGLEADADPVWPAFPADPVFAAAGMTAAGDPASAAAPIPVRILAEDAVTRDAMLACLRLRPEIRVLTHVDTDPARVVLVLAEQVTDGTLDRMGQAAAAAQVCAVPASYEIGFVLVGDGLRAHHLLGAIAHGPVSVLARRDAGTERIVRAIVGVPQGRLELPDDAVGWLVARLRTIHRDVLQPRGLTAAGLGTREVEVLRLLAEGLDTAQIAQEMNYSERTVKSIIHGVLTRCRLRNRAHAVAFALRTGAL